MFCLITVNTAVAALYAFYHVIRKGGIRTWLNVAIMFLCPVVGPLVIVGAAFVYQAFLKRKQVDMEAVSFSHEKVEYIFAPDEDEKELVPIEESLLVSAHRERRKAFLKSIRLNVNKNVALYAMALENDDSETSHYSASVVMEAAAGFQETLQTISVAYEEKPEDEDVLQTYLQAVHEYLSSGILTGVERRRYQQQFVFLMGEMRRLFPESLTSERYAQAVAVLLEMGELIDAEAWAQQAMALYPDQECAYLSMIRVYYVIGNAPALLETLEKLQSTYIELSRDGDALVKFFLQDAPPPALDKEVEW